MHTEDEGFALYQKAKGLLQAGGFNLQKGKTNAATLLERITKAHKRSVVQKSGLEGVKY